MDRQIREDTMNVNLSLVCKAQSRGSQTHNCLIPCNTLELSLYVM